MSRPRAFGGITELSVAYETLRNPARRRTYDASIGVNAPRTEPPKPAVAWRAQAQFVAAPAATPRPDEPQLKSEPQVRPEPAAKAEPVLPSFLANALRELAEPAPLNSQAREAPRAPSGAGPRVAPSSAPPAALETPIDEVEDEQDGGAQWKRIAIPAAGLVAVVGLIGAWAGWQSQGAPAARTEQAALLAPPTTFAVGDPANAAAQGDAVLDKDEPLTVTQPKRTAHVASRRAKPRPVSHLAEIEQQLTPPTETAAAEPAPAEQVAAAEPAKAVAASMPLSNSVIARTIARIGYPCGSVASTSQILGKAFTVTCTSGHTYRAAPVRGRYHFRQVKGG
jgi:hypothetical protein